MFDHGRFHPEQVLTGLVGGFFSLAFIWFITSPVGVFTYVICRVNSQPRLLATWLLVWCGLGAASGLALGRWSASLVSIASVVCAVIGLLTGVVLHRFWSQEVSRGI